MKAYANAGAIIQEDISEATAIFGVKQVISMLTYRDLEWIVRSTAYFLLPHLSHLHLWHERS